jgi:hypothetical protein
MEKEKYEKILVELYYRIKNLEKDVEKLKTAVVMQNTKSKEPRDVATADDDTKNRRAQSRNNAMDALRRRLPDYIVMKAIRQEGGGIKIVSRYDSVKPVLIKFSYSKCYHKREIEHSWFTIQLNEIDGVVDYCLFAMLSSNNEWQYFMFRTAELVDLCRAYHENDGNNVHLYFAIEEGEAFEIRYDRANVTRNWNNWDILTDFASHN